MFFKICQMQRATDSEMQKSRILDSCKCWNCRDLILNYQCWVHQLNSVLYCCIVSVVREWIEKKQWWLQKQKVITDIAGTKPILFCAKFLFPVMDHYESEWKHVLANWSMVIGLSQLLGRLNSWKSRNKDCDQFVNQETEIWIQRTEFLSVFGFDCHILILEF